MRKLMTGTVTSDKMDKTVVVRVERLSSHAKYHKILRRSSKFKAHDEGNECRAGDQVVIEESRPLSREKRWRVVRVLETAKSKEEGQRCSDDHAGNSTQSG